MASNEKLRQATEADGLRQRIQSIVQRLPSIEYHPRACGEIDYYGARFCIAKLLGLAKPLFGRATWTHGWQWYDIITPDMLVDAEYKNLNNLVISKRHEQYLRERGYKTAVAVGAPLLYAEHVAVPRIPGSLLVFPVHTSQCTKFTIHEKINTYVEYVRQLQDRFSLVVASIGYEDVRRGNWIPAFEHAGIPWISGAWSHDKQALTRIGTLMRHFEFATSNCPGSHFAYAAYCGCKMSFNGPECTLLRAELDSHPQYKRYPEIARAMRENDLLADFKNKFPFFFVEPDQATAQVDWARQELGEDNKKAPEDIAALFGWKLRQRPTGRWAPIDVNDVLTNEELFAKAMAKSLVGRNEDAFRFATTLKSRQVRVKDLELIRARYFLSRNDAPAALETLKEELRHFPDNALARKLFEELGGEPLTPRVPPRDAPFLSPQLSPEFADLYLVRKAILERLNQAIPSFSGTLLDVGCGQMPYRDHILAQNPSIKRYIGLDFATGKYAERMQPDLTWDGSAIPLPDGAVDCAMATEVLEHCPEPLPVLAEIRRVLTPGGFLFFTTPFLWPIHDAPHDHYRYTPYALQRLLTEAGFEDVRIEALGGWNASLAQMIGLWLRRAPMSGETRERLNRDLYPFFTELLRTDTLPADFSKNPMITGLAGTARTAKPRAAIPTNTDGPRVIVVTDQFPVLSQTFILDQMTGLIDRGVAVEHWSMQRMDEPVMHENVRAYGLLEATHYITLPADALRKDPRLWTERFLRDNNIAPLDDVVAVQVHFGPNFNKLAPLFTAYPDLFTLTSFHGYDGSATFQVKGADVYEQLFARSNLITTPSLFMKETLTRYGCPPDKIVVQHYGKDAREFAPVPREPGRQTVKLLSVARFVEKKGLEYALAAFAKAQVGCDTEYRLIGYGPLEQKLVALARSLGVADKVVFLGQLPGDQVRREMNDADIFVLTSVTAANGDTEGVPVSLIEAQLLGLPVVSSRHAGIPELVVHNETGFLAEERNVAEIAGYLRALMHSPGIREVFSRNARAHALGAFEAATRNDTLADLLLHHKTERARPAAADATEARTSLPNRVYCPICRGRFGQFMPFGKPARQNALCPACGSLERHRALWAFLERHTDFFASPSLRLLHFAPEACLESRFRELFKARYVTADLLDRRADVQADITDLRFPDASFDVVYCSHVLEHVPEDRKAMRELHRVLDKDGIAIVMVPLRGQVTDEDLSVTSPEERTRRYGQWDHVRYYGLDIVGRLEEAGFAVQAVETAKTFTPDEMALMRLSSDWIFLCRKRGGAKTGAGPRPSGREASAKAQTLRAAADHWSTTQTQARTRWWLHPTILRHVNALVGGQPEDGPWAGLERRMRGLSEGRGFPRGVSVACGSASKERSLLQKGLVGTFDLFEISGERLAAGKAAAARQGLADRALFHALDAFSQDLDDRYDLVYWNNALHHMLDAREALLWSRDRLRPGGWLVLDDYVGATRFQWPDAQLEIASRIRRALPERLLRDPARPQTSCPVAVTRPRLADMLATDPTEAADSDNILPSLRDIFPGARTLFTGGVVYSLALKDIIANFDDATDAARLQELLAYDAALAADGQTLYACAFARKQGAPGAQG